MITQEAMNTLWKILSDDIKEVPLYTVIKLPYEEKTEKRRAIFIYSFGKEIGQYEWKFVSTENATL